MKKVRLHEPLWHFGGWKTAATLWSLWALTFRCTHSCSLSPTHHTLDNLIFAIVFLNLEEMIAEVEDVEASLLSQESDDHAACPVEAISKTLPRGQEMSHVNKHLAVSKLTCLWCRSARCSAHSTVNSWAPTGMQYTNCMALQRRWNSTHSSTCITPLLGNGPRQMGSSKKPRTRARMTSNMDKPQHSLSLVSRSPSRAMAIC